uniref:Sushi domain-containing protein n=1 Tax=Gouania willdenowi TaxID=441366 RepID=A0A8C5DZ83_GOUWI
LDDFFIGQTMVVFYSVNMLKPHDSCEFLQRYSPAAPPSSPLHISLVPCGKPPLIADGVIVAGIKEQYKENDQVTYGCPIYYTIEGGPYKTCINGEWIGEIRCNKPCTLDHDAMNRQNIEFKYSRQDRIYSEHNDEIEFRCKRGMTKFGPVSMRQRCVDGVIDLPTCSGR